MLSDALAKDENGMITFVGAGGKSSLMRKLAMEWREQGRSFLLTTTTKMFYQQIIDFAPVFCDDYNRGLFYVEKNLNLFGYAGWFKEYYDNKVSGIPLDWIEKFSQTGLVSSILIEGDGARQKLLKAPGDNEPIVSSQNKIVVGVLNLGAIGQELSPAIVHRLENVIPLIGKRPGEKIEPQDIAALACHKRGIFFNTYGERILALTNVESCDIKTAEEIIEIIKNIGKSGIRRFVITKGYDMQVEPILIIN